MPQLKVLHYLSDDVYNNGEPYLVDSDWITEPQTLTSFPVGLKIKYKCKEGIFSAKIDEQTCPLEEEQTSQSSNRHLMSQITKTSTTCARNQSTEEQRFPIVTALEDENLPTCSSYLNNTSGQETNAIIEPSIIDPTFDMAVRPVPPDDYSSSLLAHSLPVNLTPQPGKQQKLSNNPPVLTPITDKSNAKYDRGCYAQTTTYVTKPGPPSPQFNEFRFPPDLNIQTFRLSAKGNLYNYGRDLSSAIYCADELINHDWNGTRGKLSPSPRRKHLMEHALEDAYGKQNFVANKRLFKVQLHQWIKNFTNGKVKGTQ